MPRDRIQLVWFAIGASLVLAGCAGGPSLTLTESQMNPHYIQPPAQHVLVMALYPDAEFELRALAENAFTGRLNEEGAQATPGYRYFDKYEGLLAGVGVDEAAQQVLDKGIDTVIFIDPLRAIAYDPGESAARRDAYRVWGLDTAAGFDLMGDLAEEADAAKVVMQVTLWSPAQKEIGWTGNYNSNAPNNYDVEIAKGYFAEFASAVAEQLRQDGFLK